MRPKLIALIAVSAVALVGCSTGEPSVAPTVTVTASPSVVMEPEKTPTQITKVVDPVTGESILMDANGYEIMPTEDPALVEIDRVESVEQGFADFAETRASVYAVKIPNRAKVIESLHKFCESDESIKVSSTQELNENLEIIAERSTCAELD